MATLIPWFLLIPLLAVFGVLAAHGHSRVRMGIILAASAALLLLSIALALGGPETLHYEAGGWPAPYGIALRADALSRIMLLTVAVVFLGSSVAEIGSEARDLRKRIRLTYHLTFPLLMLAMNGLFLTADFFNFYVFFELAAVSSYLLVAMGRHHSLEAAWKYALQSVLGSAALLSAVAFIYGTTGSLNMADVFDRLQAPLVWIAPFVLIAFLVKGSLFPFHFWQPDAYAAATTAGSSMLAGAVTNVGLYGLLRFWPLLFGGELRWILPWLGTASVIFGALAAWRETDAKRLLGFSSTSQLGFVLIAMGWFSPEATAAALVFLVHHALSKSLLFLSSGVLVEAAGATGFGSLGGMGVAQAVPKAGFLLGLLSLIGLPPALGFVGKFGLLQAGIRSEAWPWVLAVAAGSVLTLVYGVRAFQLLFWKPAEKDTADEDKAPAAAMTRMAIVFLAVLVLSAGLYPRPLWNLSAQAASDAPVAKAAGRMEAQ